MSGTPARSRLAVVGFLLALALAVGSAAWQGARRYAVAEPAPGPVLARDQPVAGPGFAVRVTGVQRAASLPAAEVDASDIEAPAGGEIVLVEFTAELTDPTATKDVALCDFALLAPDGTRWTTESDLSYGIRRPDAYGCGGSSDAEIAPGRPVQGGVSFLVPAAAQGLVLEVGLSAFDQVDRRRL